MQLLKRAVAPHAVVADDGGVEGQRGSGDARRVRWTLPFTVVGVVSRRRDDPVVPANVLKVDVELPFAADLDVLVTLQSTLLPQPRVTAVLLLDLDYQKGPVGLILLFAAHQDRPGPRAGTQGAGDAKAQDRVLLALQQQLNGCRHREHVPAAAACVNALLHQKGLMW